MPLSLSEFLARLTGVVRQGDGWMARCPAHEDHRQSLSVHTGTKQPIVLKCHAGCSMDAILAALGLDPDAISLPRRPRGRPPGAPRARASRPPDSEIVATYDYRTAAGLVVAQVVRYQTKDFRQRRPDPIRPGEWLWNMDGVPRIPYRLDELAALRPETVVVTEGEKDADACWDILVPATTNLGGAGKWTDADTAALVAGGVKQVIAPPDNDPPGREHAAKVVTSARAAGLRAYVLPLPGVPEHGDVSDFLRTRGAQAFRDALLACQRPVTLQDVHAVFVKWLGESYDLQGLDAVLAAGACERLGGVPPWIMLISGSGAAKTETVQSLEGAGAYIKSTIASVGAFLSGSARREKTADSTGGILRVIGEHGILVLKDFGSILSMDRTARPQVMAALREIHDGTWVREVGTDGGRTLAWQGRLVVVAACTSAWDRAHEAVSTMGDRFILVRFDSTYGRRAAFRHAMKNNGHEADMHRELSEAVGALLAAVDPAHELVLTPEEEDRFYDMVNLVTLTRTAVDTDFREDVLTPHAHEYPTRYGKQLWQLVRGATALGMSRAEALNLAGRCAHDTVPPVRMAILKDLARHPDATTADLANRLNLPWNTVKRQLDALMYLGLIHAKGPVRKLVYWLRAHINPDSLSAFAIDKHVGGTSHAARDGTIDDSVGGIVFEENENDDTQPF